MIKHFIAILSLVILTCGTGLAKTPSLRIVSEKGSYFLDISKEVLGKDIFLGSRVVDLSSQKNISAGQTFLQPIVLRCRLEDKLLVMDWVNTDNEWNRNDPAASLIERNNTTPVYQMFETVANPDPGVVRIDVTKLFSDDSQQLCPLPSGFKQGKLEPKLSGIERIYNYDNRVNLITKYYYTGGREPFYVRINYSVAIAPEPMRPRLDDERIGVATVNKTIYATEGKVDRIRYVTRWRIEPRPEDMDKHRRGTKVEPAKPIVMYVDPNIPASLYKYVKMGILDWNPAFEAIGFKNAIQVKDIPQSEEFNAEDIYISAFRFVPTVTANAMGKTLLDPRTGEIIQGDVMWYQNVVKLLQEWRFVQTAVADPKARGEVLDQETLGQLIRYAVAHEMGHVLGFQHNMRASYAIPVDSLRSPAYTKKYGTTMSIMDYARNNFVAQQGDAERGVRMTPPPLGIYDYFAVEWLYKPVYEAKTPQDEQPYLDKLFVSKGKDPKFIFAKIASVAIPHDPSGQADMLGDDAIKAAGYCITNLRKTVDNLIEWTTKPGGTYSYTNEMYDAISKQFFKMLNCSSSYIGGVYYYPGTVGQYKVNYVPVDKAKARQATLFVMRELLDYPMWMDNRSVTSAIGSKTEMLMKNQIEFINSLLAPNNILDRLVYNGSEYTSDDLLTDIESALFAKDIKSSQYTRALQLSYIKALKEITTPTEGANHNILVRNTAAKHLTTLNDK